MRYVSGADTTSERHVPHSPPVSPTPFELIDLDANVDEWHDATEEEARVGVGELPQQLEVEELAPPVEVGDVPPPAEAGEPSGRVLRPRQSINYKL
jgi:hypothetical protein